MSHLSIKRFKWLVKTRSFALSRIQLTAVSKYDEITIRQPACVHFVYITCIYTHFSLDETPNHTSS